MTTNDADKKTPEKRSGAKRDDSAARLAALLRDLETLQAYLKERGRHSYELAQKFMANAQRDAGSRAYDERQATMLEYQHYIWNEIAGRVSQLLMAYEPDDGAKDSANVARKPPSGQDS
ncbi:MAG TPA: hypothetical protein VFU63_13415 [Ktedonobacterales bacterium]|nr:hypothetical protein [Ktedonobacterales bacterium]